MSLAIGRVEGRERLVSGELQLGQIDLLICAMDFERLKKLGLNVFL